MKRRIVFENDSIRVEEVFGRNPIHDPVDWERIGEVIEEGWQLLNIYSPDIRNFHKVFAVFKVVDSDKLLEKNERLTRKVNALNIQVARLKKKLEG